MSKTNAVVIYASKYGTTEAYAKDFATALDLPVCDYHKCPTLVAEPGIEKVYVFAPIYRRTVAGLPEIAHVFDPDIVERVFVVGMTDPEDKETIQFLEDQVHDYMPRASVSLLGGKINIDKVSTSDKMLLKVMYAFEKRKAMGERTPTEQRLVEMVESRQTDMTDMTPIEHLLENLQKN